MKFWYVALLIILWSVSTASAVAPKPEDSKWWAPAVSGTLYKGNTLANGEFTVKAVLFPSGVPGVQNIQGNIIPETEVDPMVYLEVYKNSVLIKEIILTMSGSTYIDPDNEVKISIPGFPAWNLKEWVLEY